MITNSMPFLWTTRKRYIDIGAHFWWHFYDGMSQQNVECGGSGSIKMIWKFEMQLNYCYLEKLKKKDDGDFKKSHLFRKIDSI